MKIANILQHFFSKSTIIIQNPNQPNQIVFTNVSRRKHIFKIATLRGTTAESWTLEGHFPQIYTAPLLEVTFLNIHVRNLILCL